MPETIRGHDSDAPRTAAADALTDVPNTTPRSRRWLAALCAASLLLPAAPVTAQNNLPALGDAATEDFGVATERRIGEDGLFTKKRPTLMFNGYEAQVGQLYAGMDLKKNY